MPGGDGTRPMGMGSMTRRAAVFCAGYAAPGSREEEELELLSLLVEKYEDEHFPIDLPDPVEVILYVMDQKGLTRRDLEHYLGSVSRVSEVLNRKRPLSKEMIRNLVSGLGIPVVILLQAQSSAANHRPSLSHAGEITQYRLPLQIKGIVMKQFIFLVFLC